MTMTNISGQPSASLAPRDSQARTHGSSGVGDPPTKTQPGGAGVSQQQHLARDRARDPRRRVQPLQQQQFLPQSAANAAVVDPGRCLVLLIEMVRSGMCECVTVGVWVMYVCGGGGGAFAP